ncbi:glycosyltransferase family 1 protein [Nemorincola caseinilytica]|uniref:Glycosyltransferase family 1 protein n=1 Tax=Nemorincola caseinilytica TaxID=2054315 RepID=A0ABP8N674_9BACT
MANELGVTIIGKRRGHAWEQTDLPLYLARQGRPPLWNPCNTAPLLYSNNFITLHDLAFYHHPEWNSKRFAMWYNILIPRVVKGARHIFTVSETIKREITNIYHRPAQGVSVTYNGISDAMLTHERQDRPKERMILSVGSFNKRKNHHSLIKAFCESDLKNTHTLVMMGDKNRVFSETGINEEDLQRDNIKVLRDVPEQELMDMYSRAEIVVSLSLYEGFGIPVLEGLYHGCKVVCSDIAVYRELYGDVATFCDPLDTTAIAQAIRRCADGPAPYAAQVQALCNRYNYDTAADTIINVMTGGKA